LGAGSLNQVGGRLPQSSWGQAPSIKLGAGLKRLKVEDGKLKVMIL